MKYILMLSSNVVSASATILATLEITCGTKNENQEEIVEMLKKNIKRVVVITVIKLDKTVYSGSSL